MFYKFTWHDEYAWEVWIIYIYVNTHHRYECMHMLPTLAIPIYTYSAYSAIGFRPSSGSTRVFQAPKFLNAYTAFWDRYTYIYIHNYCWSKSDTHSIPHIIPYHTSYYPIVYFIISHILPHIGYDPVSYHYCPYDPILYTIFYPGWWFGTFFIFPEKMG
jgi:hypothetical protein